ncbi:PaiB family negative transcriptional regulator [Stella humosa]|uniref:PaiB family negative transcriptional regulator n=1 Tax=Stella humosa TaxID=94 RepID=A0A3N1MGW8_9PROT|nr:FMN-binding negative transcriptional regulator [Stella humosa]ROQ01880.1 PaiB family negative transcriptional regulator [Stella humosa]BBK32269.1 transcriptional regulator [Stella humosa]
MLYNPPHFRENDRAVLVAHIARAAFATLVTQGADGPIVSHLPMLMRPDPAPGGALIGHVARANPQWRASDLERPALAIFMGPHAYVSPSWYPGKPEHGRVVPTWNYGVVHVTGRLVVLDDPDAVLDIVERLTNVHEAGFEHPWKVSDAPADFVRAQLKGIVGLRLEITAIEGKMKLSQNRAAADRAGVVAGLESCDEPASAALAGAMRETGSGG